MSVSPSADETNNARQRTRNAQAQADLRARRKQYIKSLEDTVAALESCVRQLSQQNAEFHQRLDQNTAAQAGPSSPSLHDTLVRENSRLHRLLAELGLAAAASAKLARMGKDGPQPASGDPFHVGNAGELARLTHVLEAGLAEVACTEASPPARWTETQSIQAKRRRVSEAQTFAFQTKSQLSTAESPSLQSSGIACNRGGTHKLPGEPITKQGPDVTASFERAAAQSDLQPMSSGSSVNNNGVASHPTVSPHGQLPPLQDGARMEPAWSTASLFQAPVGPSTTSAHLTFTATPFRSKTISSSSLAQADVTLSGRSHASLTTSWQEPSQVASVSPQFSQHGVVLKGPFEINHHTPLLQEYSDPQAAQRGSKAIGPISASPSIQMLQCSSYGYTIPAGYQPPPNEFISASSTPSSPDSRSRPSAELLLQAQDSQPSTWNQWALPQRYSSGRSAPLSYSQAPQAVGDPFPSASVLPSPAPFCFFPTA